jgi:hypothetical protein
MVPELEWGSWRRGSQMETWPYPFHMAQGEKIRRDLRANCHGLGYQSHSISLELVSTEGSEQTSSPSLLTVQPESVPDPKTPAAHDVAASDKKIPKISPARNFNMQAPCFR